MQEKIFKSKVCALFVLGALCVCTPLAGQEAPGAAPQHRERSTAPLQQSSNYNRREKASDKLKLTSVAMLDGSWHFGVTDLSSKKTFWVKLGAPRPFGGVSVDAYNPDTNTALVSSEYGRFVVVMKEPASGGDIEQRVIPADADVNVVKEQMQQAITEFSQDKPATRADTLKLIKPKKRKNADKPRKNKEAKAAAQSGM